MTHFLFQSGQAVWSDVDDCIEAGPVQTVDGLRSKDPDDALIVSKALSRQCGMA
ncbi:MAG: hypothetical protein IPM02_18740 [Betaproteobacteria bacterium]|nr:hypothetical protein [Betaproteobacteria bacterium]